MHQNTSHNDTQPDNTTQADNDSSSLGEALNQSTVQQGSTTTNTSFQNQNQSEQTGGGKTGAEVEKAAESAGDAGTLFEIQFIAASVMFLIIIILSIVLLIKRGKEPRDSFYPPHQMSEISVPATPMQQWTDESGHTWRKLSDGRTQWWNGADWLDV